MIVGLINTNKILIRLVGGVMKISVLFLGIKTVVKEKKIYVNSVREDTIKKTILRLFLGVLTPAL